MRVWLYSARHVVHRLRASGHERAQHGCRSVHRRLYRAPRAPRLSQNVRSANLHIVEVDLARLGAYPAVHHAHRNAGRRPVHRHQAEAILGRAPAGRPRDHQDAVGDVGIRDEQLCAVQDVAAVAFDRLELHRPGRPRVLRLGVGQRIYLLSRRYARQHSLLLLLRSRREHRLGGQHRRRQQRTGTRIVPHDLGDDSEIDPALAESAVLFRESSKTAIPAPTSAPTDSGSKPDSLSSISRTRVLGTWSSMNSRAEVWSIV